MRRWKMVSDYFGDPVIYEAASASEAADMFAEDVWQTFRWMPNVHVMPDDSVAIRWMHDYEEGGRLFDGEEGFDRGYWLRHPNWEVVLVPLD